MAKDDPTPVPEMVERIASTIAALRSCSLEHHQKPVCPSCMNARGYHDDVGCVTLARAAIEAMREPTIEMVGAAAAQNLQMLPGNMWRGMIDVALGK